ncbi:MAG TPA: DUF167 domain-containing protein [Verrucomicrobiae bacterium]|jgi:uncharacterized protein (TIGR00251 family)|nr:DUF167 domain-containing protein [Verrucomicrobiae bacterium]
MPKLIVTVKPNARKEEVFELGENRFRVSVKAPPAEGRANEAVIEALHVHFRRPKSCFSIVSGHKSKNKIVLMEI